MKFFLMKKTISMIQQHDAWWGKTWYN